MDGAGPTVVVTRSEDTVKVKKWWIAVGSFLGGVAAAVAVALKAKENWEKARAAAAQLTPKKETVEQWHEEYLEKAQKIERDLEKATVQEVKGKWERAFGKKEGS